MSFYYTVLAHTFFSYKWQRPGKDIHEIWQPIRMWRAIELPDIHHIIFILQYGS